MSPSTPAPLTLLAIETSSNIGSVCVVTRGETFVETSSADVKLSAWLIPAIDRVLLSAGVALSDLNAVAFGAGPGAFTGVRTACATAQAIAYARGVPLIAVNSLQAMAALAVVDVTRPTNVTVLIDARMGELYAAEYFCENPGEVNCVSEPQLVSPSGYTPANSHSVLVGSGVAIWRNGIVAANVDDTQQIMQLTRQLEAHWAEGVARVAMIELSASRTIDPLNAVPIYVRNNVAQTEAERAALRVVA